MMGMDHDRGRHHLLVYAHREDSEWHRAALDVVRTLSEELAH
jgi:hypothetical protein